MDHQKSHKTNPMAQRDHIDAPLTQWDPIGLPFDPLGPCRPTPSPLGTLINSRTYLGQFGLVFTGILLKVISAEKLV